MSAARTLNYVWAAAPAVRPVPERATKPIDSLAFYRRHTEGLLRKYMAMSMQVGRTPSVLGSCMFRGRVSSYRVRSFEDGVIFVLDVEKCIKQLDMFSQDVVARIALQEYTQAETAALTGQSARSIFCKYGEALDKLTRIFLKVGLLTL
jgi:hypothetical protein